MPPRSRLETAIPREIGADLAHEGGPMRLFSPLPGGRPGATSGANRAKQQRISPADAELPQTLKPNPRVSRTDSRLLIERDSDLEAYGPQALSKSFTEV